jgi:hypothetical protein
MIGSGIPNNQRSAPRPKPIVTSITACLNQKPISAHWVPFVGSMLLWPQPFSLIPMSLSVFAKGCIEGAIVGGGALGHG